MHLKYSFTSEAELKEKLDFIYSQSKKGKSFHGIMEVAFNKVTITTAIHNSSQTVMDLDNTGQQSMQ